MQYSPVNSQHMVQNLVEEYQRNIQLLLVEDLKTGLNIVTQLLLLNWDIVLQTIYTFLT